MNVKFLFVILITNYIMDEKFLNNAYQGDKDFWFLSKQGKIADYWISKCKYPDWKRFLPLFEENMGICRL